MSEIREAYDVAMQPAKQAQAIQEILADEVPMVNWLVSWDEVRSSFFIRGNVLIGDVPLNAACYLSIREYQSGRWLKYVSCNIVHSIADLILNSKWRPK